MLGRSTPLAVFLERNYEFWRRKSVVGHICRSWVHAERKKIEPRYGHGGHHVQTNKLIDTGLIRAANINI